MDGLFKSRDMQLSEKGFVFCPKHPTHFYDPAKYSKCYLCWRDENPDKAEKIEETNKFLNGERKKHWVPTDIVGEYEEQ
jgi:hypothetical protein